MGDTLMAMCLLNSFNEPVHLTTNPESIYLDWKRILNIGDQITIDVQQYFVRNLEAGHPIIECFKFFNRYITPETVNLFGTQFKTGRRGKKCVGIMINNGEHVKDAAFFDRLKDIPLDTYPYSKFYPKSTLYDIIDLVHAAGYDPVIIDNKGISMEHKIFVLNELCDFVIGYEGGMCHVAHTLGVPSIILPWRMRSTTGGDIVHNEFLHLDRKTYFVRDSEKLKSWTPTQLLEIVDGLYNDQGNNIWLNDPKFPSIEPLMKHLEGSDDRFYSQVEWVKSHMDRVTLGGF